MVQLVRQPTKRRLPTPQLPLEDAPWRYSSLYVGSAQVVRETWTRIHGPGAVAFPEATYMRVRPSWGIFIFSARTFPIYAKNLRSICNVRPPSNAAPALAAMEMEMIHFR